MMVDQLLEKTGALEAQQRRIQRLNRTEYVASVKALVDAMAKRFGHKRIQLRSPVRRIVQRQGHVRIVSDRAIVRAKRVIVAIPPTLIARADEVIE